jgi:hypothetical protein
MLLGIVFGIIMGVGLTLLAKQFYSGADGKRIKELEELNAQYQQQVDGHFTKSSVLLKGLTEQYRELYRHMAAGAGELCSDEAKSKQLELAELTLLSQSSFIAEDIGEAPEIDTMPMGNEHVQEATLESSERKEISDEDDMPLAGEVEISPGMAEELKNQAAKS